MKIALCSTMTPFIDGGARQIVDWLEDHLLAEGHAVEKVYLPEVDRTETLYRQMMSFRWIDLDRADRVICFRPQSQLIQHDHKVLWFIHHVRVFYDLWDSPYRPCPDDAKHRGLRQAIHDADSNAIREAKAVFTNSNVISDRLRKFNGIESEVLYPPIFRPERFHCEDFNDEIVYISRVERHKRQDLLIRALALTTTLVKIRIAGASIYDDYPDELERLVGHLGLQNRVVFDRRWISEDEKASILGSCLAVAYLPVDEDSYGYPTLEAAHSSKPVLTVADSGGVLAFVESGVTGFVAEPTAEALAEYMDRLYLSRALTKKMGAAARDRIESLGISWPRVIDRLLA